jgi:hypothetical protein
MRVIRRYIDSGEWVRINYPRFDMQPVVNLDSNIEFFTITDNKPIYDSETQYLSFSHVEFTENTDVEYPHLKVAIQQYTINEIPPTETIML